MVWMPLPLGGKFASDTAYTAKITLSPKAGYTLTGVEANHFTVPRAITVTHAVNSGEITATFPKTLLMIAPGALDTITIPQTGETNTSLIADTADYTASPITWSPALGANKFSWDQVYTAMFTLAPATGRTLGGIDESTHFTVAGATSVHTNALTGVVTVVFPKTTVPLSGGVLAGVSVPKTGIQATTTVTETAQYTGEIVWSSPLQEGAFLSDTVYTATITLKAKAGYVLTGISANSFTVPGATTVTHEANSGVLIVTFPKTAKVIRNTD
jgi:hypothetical protein